MKRSPALHLAVVFLALCCCLIHSSIAEISPGSRMVQGSETVQVSGGTTHQAVTVHVEIGRMEFELNDYPGSGANGRHTPAAAADERRS